MRGENLSPIRSVRAHGTTRGVRGHGSALIKGKSYKVPIRSPARPPPLRLATTHRIMGTPPLAFSAVRVFGSRGLEGEPSRGLLLGLRLSSARPKNS